MSGCPCCPGGDCGSYFTGEGDPPELHGTITDETGDLVGILISSSFGFIGSPPSTYEWVAEDVESCCFGSLGITCVGGVFYLNDGSATCFADVAATSVTTGPLTIVFDVTVDVPGCSGTFQLTVTL